MVSGYEIFKWFYDNGTYTTADLKRFTPFVLSKEDFNQITRIPAKGGHGTIRK